MSRALPLSFEKNRWIYLFLFFLSNCLISFGGSGSLQLTAGLFGIVLPLYVAFRTSSASFQSPSYSKEIGLKPSFLLWSFLLGLALFLRFYKLTILFAWPNLDEGWIGTLALELSHHWRWRFFYTFGQAPPLTLWMVAFLFKLGLSPAWSLWLPPAVVSTATLAAAWAASREFFSKSFSFLIACLFAFSTWPLLMGRLCHQGIELPLWVCLCLFFLGRFLKSKTDSGKTEKIWALGLCAGFGSFIFTPWPAVTLVLTWALWKVIKDFKIKIRLSVHYLLALGLGLMPFLVSVVREGYGQHIASLSPQSGYFHWENFMPNLFRHLSVLVWGSFDRDSAYSPVEGGFLNPLLASFFFMGLLEMFRSRKDQRIRWITAAFALFLVPGILSLNLETFRFAQDLPLLLFITAIGFHGFLAEVPPSRRFKLCLLLVLASGIFDFSLLCSPFMNPDRNPADFGRPLKSIERFRAFGVLDRLQKQEGPGLVFTDFDVDSFNDPTLSVMTYSFNAARNPTLNPSACRWAAVFVNAQYLPFLSKQFPEARFSPVAENPNPSEEASGFLPPRSDGNILGLFPVTEKNRTTIGRWFLAHAAFQNADLARFFQNSGDLVSPPRILESAYPRISGDRFLESVFWDKMASYSYENLDYEGNLRAYQEAIEKGYPTAFFYYKLGLLFIVKNKIPEAKIALWKAAQAPLNLTEAGNLLDELNQKYPTRAPEHFPRSK